MLRKERREKKFVLRYSDEESKYFKKENEMWEEAIILCIGRLPSASMEKKERKKEGKKERNQRLKKDVMK